MDSQLTHSKANNSNLIIIVMTVVIAVAIILSLYVNRVSDPYVQKVLSRKGDTARGYEIFQMNCAGCHGKTADGSVGPSLHHVPQRKSRISLIEQVVSGKTPPMPKFQPSVQEMADLLSYLENL